MIVSKYTGIRAMSVSDWYFLKKIFAIILFWGLSNVFADARQEILLSGLWQGVKVQGNAQMPSDGWQDVNVPARTDSYGVGEPVYYWVKRQIEIPEDWNGKRIFIKFGGAGYGAKVFINDELIGKAPDGWSPFEFEITAFVNAGRTYELRLMCQDKTAVYADGFVYEQGKPEDVLCGKILAPLGGHTMFFGPWDDIFLLCRPSVYIDDITIITSTRKNQITVQGVISPADENGLWLDCKIVDSNQTVLEMAGSVVDVNSWRLVADFQNAKYWSPENPHLYNLQLTLRKGKDGAVVDVLDQRFGFKEFWIEGADFYLNGVKRYLLASSSWPVGRYVQSYEFVRNTLQMIKAGNINTFRFHTCPWPKRWIDIADEVGVMIVNEAAVYTDRVGMYAYNDSLFWKNYRTHLAGFIRRDKNNASLIMWSVENELLFMGMDKYCSDLPKKLGDLGRFVKQLDPGHPITYEGDIDPDGAADVIGLHYPHELPKYTDWPNTADWLEKRTQTEAAGGLLGMKTSNFYWDRKKPLYIGEYLWVPQDDYAAGTVFFGDDAYKDRLQYHLKAKLQAWFDQAIAYRRMRVSAIAPWTSFTHGVILEEADKPFYEAQKDFYRPIAAFLRNRDTRFFAGEIVERTFDVFNDSVADCNLLLVWRISDTNQSGEERIFLKAGEYKPVTISFKTPESDFIFQSSLNIDSAIMFTKYFVEKKQDIKMPAGVNVVLYDPCNVFSKNTPFVKQVSSFETLNQSDMLIIAPQVSSGDINIPQIGQSGFDTKGFLSFVETGGKAIILEQTSLDIFGLDLTLASKASTMTFALNKEHPVLKGIDADSLKFWRGDNYVTNYEVARPISGGAGAITVSGGSQGLEHCPILEQPYGKGKILFLQALVAAKFDCEPAARKVLQNSLDYLAGKKNDSLKTLAFNESPDFAKAIERIGVSRESLNDINENVLKNADILILHGGSEKIINAKDAVSKFLNSGKTIYWHCPDANTFDGLKDLLNADSFEIAACSGPIAVSLRENHLLTGISREDLMFLKQSQSWRKEIVIDSTVIDSALMPQKSADEMPQFVIAEQMRVSGHKVAIDGNEVRFVSRGTAICEIEVPHTGFYDLSIFAGGKAEAGVYPLVKITVDGKPVGQVSLAKEEIIRYRLLTKLSAGKNKVEISFVNGDPWESGRILLLQALRLGGIVNIPENIEILTLPAAVANIKVGSGRMVLDCVRWEQSAENIKAQRYASALFANLGVSFQIQKTTRQYKLSMDNFKLVGQSPYFDKTNTQISLRNNGTVAADFRCISDGKYTIMLTGFSTPVNGRYADVVIKIDDVVVGKKEIASNTSREFEIASAQIAAGKHTISVSFINDAYDNGQDLNFFMDGFGFKAD
jgi:hypothetical protein